MKPATKSKKVITTVRNSKMVLKSPFDTNFTVRRIKAASDFEINGVKINFIELLNDDPIYIGIDENHIFEYVIRLKIHFRI